MTTVMYGTLLVLLLPASASLGGVRESLLPNSQPNSTPDSQPDSQPDSLFPNAPLALGAQFTDEQFASPLQWALEEPLGVSLATPIADGVVLQFFADIAPTSDLVESEWSDAAWSERIQSFLAQPSFAWESSIALAWHLNARWDASVGAGWRTSDAGAFDVGLLDDPLERAWAEPSIEETEGVLWLRIGAEF